MIPIAYNVRSLRVRAPTSAAAIAGIALVVFLFSSVWMLANGLAKATASAADPDVVVALRKGADTEIASGFDGSLVHQLAALPGVAKGLHGEPEIVSELLLMMILPNGDKQEMAMVPVRGVQDGSLPFRRSMKIVAGRPPTPGTNEAMIGKGIWRKQKGLSLGEEIEVRTNRRWTVVGVFEDGGSAYESEIWADIDSVRSAFGRPPGWVSEARLRLETAGAFGPFKAEVAANRDLDLSIVRETELAESQSQGVRQFLLVVGQMVALFFALGAMLGAVTTMHATVSQRQREIGTLRALGFSRGSILASFLLESMMLALVGGAIGAVASLGMGLVHISVINVQTLSEMVVTFDPGPKVLLSALFLTCAMGVCGGFLPALRAARIAPTYAIRGE